MPFFPTKMYYNEWTNCVMSGLFLWYCMDDFPAESINLLEIPQTSPINVWEERAFSLQQFGWIRSFNTIDATATNRCLGLLRKLTRTCYWIDRDYPVLLFNSVFCFLFRNYVNVNLRLFFFSKIPLDVFW